MKSKDKGRAVLYPWDRSKPKCDHCDLGATRVGHGTMFFPLIHETVTVFPFVACDAHTDELQDELCTRYGGSASMPLRLSWRQFLLHCVPGLRWVGLLVTMWHNSKWRGGGYAEQITFPARVAVFCKDLFESRRARRIPSAETQSAA